MKKYTWIIFAALALAACNKAEGPADEPEDMLILEIATDPGRTLMEPAELPRPILSFVEGNYFDTYIETAFMSPGRGYELRMGSGENLFFGRNNNLLEFQGTENSRFGPDGPHGPCYRPGAFGSPIAVERLPNAVVRYVAANYPGNEIRRAATRSGHFIVAVDFPALLLFDETGAFVEELSPIHHCHRSCRPVRYDQLPGGIPRYVEANYSEATFRKACARDGKVVLWLTDADGRIILGFDLDGNLLFVRE